MAVADCLTPSSDGNILFVSNALSRPQAPQLSALLCGPACLTHRHVDAVDSAALARLQADQVSAALLGVFGFASQIPILFLAALGGYLGDRYNRHRGVIWTQTVSLILAFVLAALTLLGVVRVWEIILIAFLARHRKCVRRANPPGVSCPDGGKGRPAECHRAKFFHL